MKKRILALLLVAVMTVVLLPAAAAATTITLKIDNATVSSDVAPYVENGTTLVPLRVISEYLGGEVSWNQTKQQAIVQTAGFKVVFTIDSPKFTVNGAIKSLVSPARGISGRTMVPIRAFSEAVGADVSYDAATKTAHVNYFTNMTGNLKMSGSTTVKPIAEAAGAKLMEMNPGKFTCSVDGGGSSTGIKDVAAGNVDIGNASRELKDSEFADGMIPHAICNDAIVVICNPTNDLAGLTIEQAQKIFLGEITNWKDVGGADAPIVVNTRESTSGTLSATKELLLDDQEIVETATPHASNGLMVQAVAGDKYAIGFCSMGYLDPSVKGLPLNGALPSTATVINKSYPLSRELYCVTNGSATGLAAMFIDYLKSADCQDSIIVAEGYVKLVV